MSKSELVGSDPAKTSEHVIKKQAVERAKIDQQFEQLNELREENERLEKISLKLGDKTYADQLSNETEDYMMRARKSKVFLNSDFKGKVPLFGRNIILLAAETGSGKSTISANLSLDTVVQNQKVLVFSNEEAPDDCYNRITCLLRGWNYANHENFTDEQIRIMKEQIPILMERILIVGDNYKGNTGLTTTIEGIENACESILKDGDQYDVIIFDYYQNINRSVKNPGMADWQVQYRFCKFLDQFKSRSNAALIVLSQKKGSKDKELSFQESIEGRKSIMTVSTCAMNVVKDFENSCTVFEIKKSRFSACIGDSIKVGFDKGRFVKFSQEFKQKAHAAKAEKEHQKIMSNVRPSGLNGE